MSLNHQRTKYLFLHKVDAHLEDLVASNYKVTTLSQVISHERVFDQSWKKALEINCEEERQFFSQLETSVRADYLNWLKNKKYSALGPDLIHVDEVINRGLRRSYEAHVRSLEEARRDFQLREQKRIDFRQKCENELQYNYRNFESLYEEAKVFGYSEFDFRNFRNNYVKKFLFDCGLNNSGVIDVSRLDDEQLWAIGEPSDTTALITARAGSGKTTVLALRAVFLIKRFGVDPMGIVMLAFNRAAAFELKGRIAKLLLSSMSIPIPRQQAQGRETEKQFRERAVEDLELLLRENGQSLPLVSTFHALALDVVKSEANRDAAYLTQVVTDEDDEITVHSDFVNRAAAMVLESGFEPGYRKMMINQFETDWLELLRVQTLGTNPELAAEYARSYRVTMKGHAVKSRGEKLIADFLFKRDIGYKYEEPTPLDNTVTYPDFTIYSKGEKPKLIIEYFGIEGVLSYKQNSKRKVRDYSERNIPILSLLPEHISTGEFENKIIHFLLENRYSRKDVTEISSEALWEKIQVRGKRQFNAAILSFINRSYQKFLSPDDLEKLLPHSLYGVKLDENVFQFSYLATKIFRQYLNLLEQQKKTDFYQVLQNATALLAQGVLKIKRSNNERNLEGTTHIFVDEFQDFSLLFKELVDQLLQAGKETPALMAVGDSWQSINSFMGSDESIIENFLQLYPGSKELTLLKNHRSNSDIVVMGNQVMISTFGDPSVPAVTQAAEIKHFANPEFVEAPIEHVKLGNPALARLLRLISYALEHCEDVVVLLRFKKLKLMTGGNSDLDLSKVMAQLEQIYGKQFASRVRFSTVHAFKGKEAGAVILWDSNESVYPFVHSNWVFNSFFGQNREAIVREERRLFYVGVTRAKSMLIINSDNYPTDFLKTTQWLMTSKWPEVTIAPNAITERSFLQVFLNGWDEEEELRKKLRFYNFKFNHKGTKFWERQILPGEIDLDQIDRTQWVKAVWEKLLPDTPPHRNTRIRLVYNGEIMEHEIPSNFRL